MVRCVVIAPSSTTSWKLYVIFGVLLIWNTDLAGAQDDCLLSSPLPKIFSETDQEGTELVNLPGGVGARWRFEITRPGPPHSSSLAPYFRLEPTEGNATIYLNKTLDLEEVKDFLQGEFTLQFSIICSRAGGEDVKYQWFAIVTAVNEFKPLFVNIPEGGFNVSEDKKQGETILVLQDHVEDKDVVLNHMGYEFVLLPYSDAAVDGRENLTLGNILIGSVTVRTELDYEALPADAKYLILRVSVGDRNGLTSTGTVRFNIMDADDRPPEFYYPECASPCFAYYTAAIESTFQGQITWLDPAPIMTRDLDTLNSPIFYRLKKGKPTYFKEYIAIDRASGVPSVIQPVEKTDAAEFVIIVEAVEDTPLQHSQQTTLWLKVEGRNSTQPTLPPVVRGPTDDESAFRTATIVLGVLFGLVLVVFVIFIVCSMSGTVITTPVLPKAIGRLASEDEGSGVANSANSTRRKSKKSVTLAKSSEGGRLDFMRSITRRGRKSPTLRSYASSSVMEERNPDIQNLALSREIDYQQNAMDGGGELHDDLPPLPAVSTISDSAVVPHEDDAYGLMYGAEGMGEEETVGMANPAYGMERDEDGDGSVSHSVVPPEPKPDYI